LTAAYYLSQSEKFNVSVIEKEKSAGGSASGFRHKDFILDYGPHKIYTELPGIIHEIGKVTPLIKIKKRNSIYIKGNYFDFPLKISQVAVKIPFVAFNAGLDILFKPFTKRKDDSYENYLLNRFGRTLYGLSFRDYALKVWNSNPQDLDRELARRRVAISGIFQLIKSVIFKDNKKISAEYFYYPPNGMIQLIDLLMKEIRKNGGKIMLNADVSEISVRNKTVDHMLVNGKKIRPDYLISTIPLDSLASIMRSKLNPRLAYQRLNILYFILNRQRALKDCWVFFPEKEFIFQRVSEQKAFSPYTSPADRTAIMVETTREVNQELENKIIMQLEKAGILKKEEIDEHFIKSIEKAYPLYKKGFAEQLNPFVDYIDSLDNFYLLGRQGLFNYNNMDQCWDMALKVSEQIKEGKTKEDWALTKKYFDSYRIVD